MKDYAQRHPHIFSLGILFLSVLLLILVHLSTVPFASQMGIVVIIEGIGRIIVSIPFIYLLNKFGWIKKAGFQSSQNNKVWIWVVIIIPYMVFSSLLPTYKSLLIDLSDMFLVFGIIVFTFGVGLYEETVFRGVIQTTFYMKWANTSKGRFKAVIVSSLYFGGMHLINMASGADTILTITQAICTIVLGIFFGLLLVYSKSIWPAIISHWLINCVSGLIEIGKTMETNILFLSLVLIGAILPLSAGSLWLLWRISQRQNIKAQGAANISLQPSA